MCAAQESSFPCVGNNVCTWQLANFHLSKKSKRKSGTKKYCLKEMGRFLKEMTLFDQHLYLLTQKFIVIVYFP